MQIGADGLYMDKASGSLVGEIVEDHSMLQWNWNNALGLFVPVEGN